MSRTITIDGTLAEALEDYREAVRVGDDDEAAANADWIAATIDHQVSQHTEAAE